MPNEEKSKKNKFMKDIVADSKEIQDLVKSAINQGAQSIEQVHQVIAKLPLNYLGRIEKFEDTTKDIKGIQEKTIGHVYDLIKTVNAKVHDVAKEMLILVDPK